MATRDRHQTRNLSGYTFSIALAVASMAAAAIPSLTGCGGSSTTPESLARQADASYRANEAVDGPSSQAGTDVSNASTAASAIDQADSPPSDAAAKPSLAELLLSEEDRQLLQQRNGALGPESNKLPEIDEQQVAANGIRKIEGKYLTLYTDIPSTSSTLDVDEIPKVFDRAVLQWCTYFELPFDKVEGWELVGYLIKSPEKFKQADLLPGDLPAFLHGYQRGREFWVYDQPSEYYRRHLVLHEGIHGFMNHTLGGSGPPWYREGMAELLATHLWKRRKLTTAYFPKNREEVPYWGRIKIIKDELAAGRGQLLADVMRQKQSDHRRLVPYAWSWAAAAFLDSHPKYRIEFRKLKDNAADASVMFTQAFETNSRRRLEEMNEEWQLFVLNIDYGYDFVRNAVQYAAGLPLREGGQSVIVLSDRGWQSTGIQLVRGRPYQIVSKGRFKVRQSPDAWWSEPGGVTIRYHGGYPVGMLQGSMRADGNVNEMTTLGRPIPIGLNRRIVPPYTGTLYLRINDSPNELVDNDGQVTVKVMKYDPAKGATARKKPAANSGENSDSESKPKPGEK